MLFETLLFGKHLDKEEKIVYAVHRHWVRIFRRTLEIAFFGFLIPWGLYLLGFNTSFFFWLAVIWSVLAYLHFLYFLIEWYSDVWLITDRCVIVVDWKGFFRNLSTRIGYEDIEGIAYEITGFWATVFGYGEVTLKVMSGTVYLLHAAASPKKAELALAHNQNHYIHEREHMDSTQLKGILSDMVARHMREKLH